MSVKLLTGHRLEFLSLKGCCICSSESTLVKMPHCWKSHVTAHMLSFSFFSGYTGDGCQILVDQCSENSNNCENGATCYVTQTGYGCHCPAGN